MQYVRDSGEFAKYFNKTEGDALEREGLDNPSVQQALGEMERIRQDLSEHPDKLSSLLPPQSIIVKIGSVAQTACDLESRLKKEGESSRVSDAQVHRIAIGLLGSAVVAVDVLGEIPSEGVATLSIEFGAHLLIGETR